VGRHHYVAQAYNGFAQCVMSCFQRSPGHRNVSLGCDRPCIGWWAGYTSIVVRLRYTTLQGTCVASCVMCWTCSEHNGIMPAMAAWNIWCNPKNLSQEAGFAWTDTTWKVKPSHTVQHDVEGDKRRQESMLQASHADEMHSVFHISDDAAPSRMRDIKALSLKADAVSEVRQQVCWGVVSMAKRRRRQARRERSTAAGTGASSAQKP